jgi:homoserine dehydrogenase
VSVVDLPKPQGTTSSAPRVVRVALLGYGRINQALAELAARRRPDLRAAGIDLHLCRALVRDVTKPRCAPPLPLTDAHDGILDDVDVVVEAIGGVEPARTLIAAAIERGVAVVTANKSLVAAHGAALRALAERHGTPFAFEAAVVAGVPFVGALARRPLFANARRLEGILNGTSHFILTEMARGTTFGGALETAAARGCAEPDATADIDGRDAAEKLTILLQLCGWSSATTAGVARCGIDAIDAVDLSGAAAVGGTIKPIAVADLDGGDAGGAWAGPALVENDHDFARLDGVGNALAITGAGGDRVTFSGPGAGPAVTAATLIDDVVEATSGRGPVPPTQSRRRECATALHPPSRGWFLRLNLDAAFVRRGLSTRGIDARQIRAVGGRTYVRTGRTSWTDVAAALAAFGRAEVPALALPVITASSED